ncbi:MULTISPECIES: multiple cyclophane-containing RiPP AmcA [unclassified Micromonospora]|uniref:multiple cyclophane-containing RiPP AmcA n=1 Tax=unclassified Micromonospora TaxID=2617518 RepID=UPI003A86705E
MPETSRQRPEPVRAAPGATVAEAGGDDQMADRVYAVRDGLELLLAEAEQARRRRAEVAGADGAVCAWNHFENIPTFYNWNNRPR